MAFDAKDVAAPWRRAWRQPDVVVVRRAVRRRFGAEIGSGGVDPRAWRSVLARYVVAHVLSVRFQNYSYDHMII